MLQVFSIDVYALLDPDATLSFVTPLEDKMLYDYPDILIEPCVITTPWVTPLWLGESLGVVLYHGPIELHWWIR